MASSRWKRFAFFDKHALSIPSEVLSDLIPYGAVGGGGGKTSTITGGSASGGGRHAKDVSSSSQNHEDSKLLWDAVSLVVSTAALPLKSKPRESQQQLQSASAVARGGLVVDQQQHQQPPRQGESGDALSQMWSTLSACTTPEVASTTAVAGGTGDKTAAAAADQQQASSAAAVSVPSQSQSLNEGDAGASLISTEALDGLVLVFTSSHASNFVHCFDVTVRCNPNVNNKNNNNLEDLDGWRGYLAPFGRGTDSEAAGAASRRGNEDLSTGRGIIALATCRDGHGPLHLACISKQQLCIWEDPHLHLSCRLPLTSPGQTPEATRYLLESWNFSRDGHPSAVDVVPGIVTVGCDTGAVLVFIYGSNTSRNPASRKIKLYLRIPPPPATGMIVTSVKISYGSQSEQSERRVSVFVAYRRSQDSQNASAAGICCYDMPTPGPNSSSLSAPSARHDLDGRHVPASGLCDAVPTADGFHFTVARQDGLYTYNSNEKIEVSPIGMSTNSNLVMIALHRW